MQRRPYILFSALVLALALIAAACGDGDSDAGDEPTSVTLYSGRSEDLIGPLIADFEAATGIDVEVRYGGNAELALLIETEGDQSPADVFLASSPGAVGFLAERDMLQPLPDSVLGLAPSADSGLWVAVSGRQRVLVYNSDVLAPDDLPTSIFDLTQPEWLGRVAVAPTNGSFQDFVTLMRSEIGDDATLEWLTALADAGYRRICLIIGPEHDELRRYYGEELQYARLEVSFAVQEKPLGTADAVAAAEEFAGDDPFLMVNSDNYYPVESLGALEEPAGPGLPVFGREGMLAGSNIPEERLLKFAVVELGEDGYMKRILEKPELAQVAALPQPIGVSMNCWRFAPSIFEAGRQIRPSPRGELELPDAVQYAIDNLGQSFRAILVRGAVLDLTCRGDIQPAAARLAGREVKL